MIVRRQAFFLMLLCFETRMTFDTITLREEPEHEHVFCF